MARWLTVARCARCGEWTPRPLPERPDPRGLPEQRLPCAYCGRLIVAPAWRRGVSEADEEKKEGDRG